MSILKGISIAVAGGLVSALAALAFLAASPLALVFVYVAPLPLFLVGLSLGPGAGVVAGASGVAVAGALGGGVAAVMYAFIHALPACLASRQALARRLGPGGAPDWYPPGAILCSLSLLATVALLAAALASNVLGSGTEAIVANHLERGFRIMVPQLEPAEREAIVDRLAPMFPGAVGASWMMMTMVNGVLAQGLLVRMGLSQRPRLPFADVWLPAWASWPLVGFAAASLLGADELRYLGQNGALIAAVPYFLLGLAVAHAFARWRGLPVLPLVVFYLVVVISDWAKLLVAGFGVAEHWVGLRSRLPGRSPARRPGGSAGDGSE